MARTRRALAAPSPRRWRLSTASRTFRVLHRLNVILSLRRIRDPSARGDEVRILRLRSRLAPLRMTYRSYGARNLCDAVPSRVLAGGREASEVCAGAETPSP